MPSGSGAKAVSTVPRHVKIMNTDKAIWTGEQLESALGAYRKILGLESAGKDFVVGDIVCELSAETGARYSALFRLLANMAWLAREKGLRTIARIEASGDMSAETRADLERLLDEAGNI